MLLATAAAALVLGARLTSRSLEARPELAGSASDARRVERSVKRGDPNRLAADGAPLQLVMNPPAKTHAILDLPEGSEGVSLSVRFRPYGLAPDGSLVARITWAETASGPDGARGIAARFVGENFLLRFGPGVSPGSVRGGEYAGRVRLARGSGGHVLVLTRARPSR